MDWSKLRDDRRLVVISAVGYGVFVVCYAVAIALYPGGTWWAPNTVGHSLWLNFLCDLMQTEALNGERSPVGSLAARVGMFAMIVSLAAFYAQLRKLEEPPSRLGNLAERAGLLACALGVTIPIITSDLWRLGHLISVVAMFLPSLVAAIAALVICMRVPVSWVLRGAAIVTLGAGAIDGFLYLYVYTAPVLGLVPRSPETRILVNRALPFFQRIATFGVLVWVPATCLHTWRTRVAPRA